MCNIICYEMKFDLKRDIYSKILGQCFLVPKLNAYNIALFSYRRTYNIALFSNRRTYNIALFSNRRTYNIALFSNRRTKTTTFCLTQLTQV